MAKIVADRVLEVSSTTGTGSLTLSGAVTGFRTFSSVCANGDTFDYYIESVDNNGAPSGYWETGLGSWSTGGTMNRLTVYSSSNSGALVNFVVGNKRVGLTLSAKSVDIINPFLLIGA